MLAYEHAADGDQGGPDIDAFYVAFVSVDSVSGSRYYGQLMEKLKAGSSDVISGGDSILIDLSFWYKESLVPKFELIRTVPYIWAVIRGEVVSREGNNAQIRLLQDVLIDARVDADV